VVVLLPASAIVNEKALWPATILGSVTIVAVSILLWLGVDATSIISVFSIAVTGTLSVVLFNKVSRIEQNTNGAATEKDHLVRDFLEYLKSRDTK